MTFALTMAAMASSGLAATAKPARPAVAPPPAAKKVKCADASIQENCDGRDPVTQGCDVDTEVIDRVALTTRVNSKRVGTLRLIYSRRCATFWGRVTSNNGDPFDVSVSGLRGRDFKLFTTSQQGTGTQTTANSPMFFNPTNASATVLLIVSRTGEQISRTTRTCPPPSAQNACSPPTVPEQ